MIENGYLTLAEFKARLGTVTTADEVLEDYVETASRQIDDWTGRAFYPTTAASRTFAAWDGFVEISDAQVITSVTDGNGTIIAAADYRIEDGMLGVPAARLHSGYFVGGDLVTIVGNWGWLVAPAPVKEATAIQATRLWKRKDAPFGIVGSAEFGTLRSLGKIDPDVAELVRPYVRYEAVV